MALAFGPDGQLTSTLLLEQAERDRQVRERLERLDRAVIEDAVKWRTMLAKRRESRKKGKVK